jgi:hypothetical protein
MQYISNNHAMRNRKRNPYNYYRVRFRLYFDFSASRIGV